MNIRDVKLVEITGHHEPGWCRSAERLVRPLDIYPEFRDEQPRSAASPNEDPVPIRHIFVEVHTDSEVGRYGPLLREQAFLVRTRLRPFLLGRDARPIAQLWDQMVRLDRHSRTGYFMMAISAVDCALWDLRGRALGEPVCRLLGGPTRQEVAAYASALGYSLGLEELTRKATEIRDAGFTAQKWFFRYGPASGPEGKRRNLETVRVLRETLGDGSALMFDAWMSWTPDYAIELAHALQPFRPAWLEEPLPPDDLKGYARVKQATGAPLAAGEHLYTRWQVLPFLDAEVLNVVQTDPDWTGGITELVRICALAEPYGVQVVPHGHNIAAALHVVAAEPPTLCPMAEFLLLHAERQQFFLAHPLRPERGTISLPDQPGLGMELDERRVEARRELTFGEE